MELENGSVLDHAIVVKGPSTIGASLGRSMWHLDMTLKLVHAADLHLDSPMVGLERYEGAPVDTLRCATRRAFENLMQLCLDERADLLLLAGDLFDGDWRDYGSGLFFCAALSRLKEQGTRVVLLRGNHDAQSQLTKQLSLPDHVHELPVRRPGSVVFEDLGVAVHGQGFVERAVLHDLTAEYPAPLPGLFNVGLLHTCLDDRAGHERYAPTSTQVLVQHGYDYWALGHIHTREIVHREPWIVYPGNLQGRHMRERGPKGATLIEVEAGRVSLVEERVLDVVRWQHARVDAAELVHPDDLLAACQDVMLEQATSAGRLVALRLEVFGNSALHATLASDPEHWLAELRRVANEVGQVWLESLVVGTRAHVELADLRLAGGPIGQLAQSLARMRAEPEELAAFHAEFSELERRLPRALREGPLALGLTELARTQRELDAVEQLLLPLLFEAEGSA